MNTAWRQQSLSAWQPLLTPRTVIPSFFCVGLVFIIIGAVALVASDSLTEQKVHYGDVEGCKVELASDGTFPTKVCKAEFEVKEDVEGPVYMYYELENYFQNHRSYVQSRSDKQLRGDSVTTSELDTSCEPMVTRAGKIINPCGLIANSFFNDTFTLQDSNNAQVALKKEGIAWPSDLDVKFKEQEGTLGTDYVLPEYWPKDDPAIPETAGTAITKTNDEDVVVWMRVAALPTFRKLHRILEDGLKKGKYTLTVVSRFPIDTYGGSKRIVFSQSSWIGGRNPFLGWGYLIVGFISLGFGVGFLMKQLASPRELGDQRLLTWG